MAPKGGLIWGIIVEGSYDPTTGKYLPATKAQLDAWISSESAPNTWSLDSAGSQPTMETYFSTGRDTYVLIDLSTMRIAKIDHDETTALTDFGAMLN